MRRLMPMLANDNGFALVSVLLFAVVLSVLMTAVVLITLNSQGTVTSTLNHTQALSNARAGIAVSDYNISQAVNTIVNSANGVQASYQRRRRSVIHAISQLPRYQNTQENIGWIDSYAYMSTDEHADSLRFLLQSTGKDHTSSVSLEATISIQIQHVKDRSGDVGVSFSTPVPVIFSTHN